MSAAESTSPHQFADMHSRLQGGGFTYNPRTRTFPTSGYSVAAHPGAELSVPHAEGGASLGDIRGFTHGSQPIWNQQKGQNRGQEMIGGWRDDEGGKDVLDLPKVFPATPGGHAKSRQAQVLRNQEASFSLHEGQPEANPWFTGSKTTPPARMAANFPEFGAVARNNPRAALDASRYPEIASWSDQPTREAGYQRESKIKARRAAQA